MLFKTRFFAAVFLINLCVIGLVSLSLQNSRRQHEKRIEDSTANLARALSDEISLILGKIDFSLQDVRDEAETELAEGRIRDQKINRHIRKQFERYEELESIRVADADGNVRWGIGITRAVNIRDRDYFIRLKEDHRDEMVFAQPVVSRMAGKWVLNLARGISGPHGEFSGVVFAQLPLSWLQEKFGRYQLGSHGIVSLRDLGLRLIVRHPEMSGLGSGVGERVVLAEFASALAVDPDQGVFFMPEGLDQIARIISYRRVGAFPMILLVGRARIDYLEIWWSEVRTQVFLVALFLFVSSILGWMVYRAWERIRQAKDTLELKVKERTQDLEHSLSMVKKLEGLLPICAYCKKIRDKDQSWLQLEQYISHNSEASFTHGVCPECKKRVLENRW